MFRLFTKLILILFILVAGGIVLLMVTGESREGVIRRTLDDTKATANLTGRFIEHLITERVDRLYAVSYHEGVSGILEGLADYTDFVGSTYGHRGSFTIGLMDSGFKMLNSFNSDTAICSPSSIINEDIAKRLLVGRVYVGPVSEECAAQSDSGRALTLIAVPVIDADGFNGAVFEVSTLMEYLNSYSPISERREQVSVKLLVEDVARYPLGSPEIDLLYLKEGTARENSVMHNGRAVSFYSFYLQDIKLSLVYISDVVKTSFAFTCCPALARHKNLIFISPFILLVLWILLEMVNVNEKLGREVALRTRHLDAMRYKYQELFATIPESVLLFNKEGEILECNSKFADMMSGGNPIGANIIYMIREKERFRRVVEELSDEEPQAGGDFFLIGRDEPVEVSVNMRMADIDGEKAIVAIMNDMTEYKKMQSSFSQEQKREVVGTLAAGMVHDFSNILQNISLQYSMLERSAENREKHMDNIRKILEGANSYLSSVLTYTKDVKDDYEVKAGKEFVNASLAMVERVLPADIEICYEDFSGRMKIKAIQTKMTQLLINLCQNASDAMGGKGVVYVKNYIVEKPYGRFFSLSVRDTGSGIRPEDIERIYKPFFTTKTGKGTGLGLATVKQIVLESGAMIEVESKPDEGTEFIIMFSEML